MSEPTESRSQRAARRAGEFPPAPEPLPLPVLDSHTHLDITVSEAGVPGGGDATDPVAAAIDVAAAVGVDRLVQVGVDVASSRWGVEAAGSYPAVVATVALHPNEAPGWPTSTVPCARSRHWRPRTGCVVSARPEWTATAPVTRAAPRRRKASARTSPSPNGTAARL
ncbi:hypothetical protein GCM10029963_39320 [Micromonospora andamanensis]